MIKSRRTKLIKWLSGVSVIMLMLGISVVTVFAAGNSFRLSCVLSDCTAIHLDGTLITIKIRLLC